MRPNPFAGVSDEYADNPPPPHDVPPGARRSVVIDQVLAQAQSRIFLDIGRYTLETPGWTVMDDRDGVQVRHDPLEVPWPFADESVYYIRCFHMVEHVPTACREHPLDPLVDLLDEMWRVLCPGGTVWITCPHADSHQAWADPTNRRVLTEETFEFTRRAYREQMKFETRMECDFTVGHGCVLDFTGDIAEMHVSLVKGVAPWLAQPSQ